MAARPCTKAYGRHYPGRQMADDWLDFMLSQRNLWPTFTTKGAQITGQAFVGGGQAELECVVRPDVHSGPLGRWEFYTPHGGSNPLSPDQTSLRLTPQTTVQTVCQFIHRTWRPSYFFEWQAGAVHSSVHASEVLPRRNLHVVLHHRSEVPLRQYMRYYSTRLPGASHRNPYEEKAYRGPAHKEVQAWWEHNAKRGCCITNANVRHWKAFCMHSGKEEDTRVGLMHISIIAENGGKQERALTSSSDDDPCRMWETRLSKKMQQWTWMDIWPYTWMAWRTTSWWKRWYEGLRGARVVSPFFASLHWPFFVCVGVFWCLFCLLFVGFAGENSCI